MSKRSWKLSVWAMTPVEIVRWALDSDIPGYGSIDVPINHPSVAQDTIAWFTATDGNDCGNRIHTNCSAGPTGWFGSHVSRPSTMRVSGPGNTMARLGGTAGSAPG